MRKVIHKFFWVWNFDKEEKWLNEMAAKGLALISVGFCRYEFEESLPGEYNVCLQLLENSPKHPEGQKYIEFLEETGAQHVGTYLNWVYLRKKAADGEFELFSDNASRIKHLTRIIQMIAFIFGANFLIGCYNVGIYLAWGNTVNLLGIVNILLSLLGTIGCMRLASKRKRLKSEQQLFE